jgi:hypothetical protein
VSYRLIDYEPEGRTDKVSAMRGHSVAEARLPLLAQMRNTLTEQMFSGLPSNSDMAGCRGYFAFVPTTGMGPSINYQAVERVDAR